MAVRLFFAVLCKTASFSRFCLVPWLMCIWGSSLSVGFGAVKLINCDIWNKIEAKIIQDAGVRCGPFYWHILNGWPHSQIGPYASVSAATTEIFLLSVFITTSAMKCCNPTKWQIRRICIILLWICDFTRRWANKSAISSNFGLRCSAISRQI